MITKFLSAIAATALTGSLAFAVPAHAQGMVTVRTDSTTETVQELVNRSQELGIEIQSDTQECKDTPGLMGYMMAPSMLLVLCIENHGQMFGPSAFDNLADTIRHELVHAAQFCKSSWSTDAVLFPENVRFSQNYAQTHLNWDVFLYPDYQWPMEGEARTLAFFLNDAQIADLLDESCRYTNTGNSMVPAIRAGQRPLYGLPRPIDKFVF